MKGIIFNLLEEFITENWGEEKYEEILKGCPIKTKEPFVGPGTYPDADLIAIVTKTVEKLGVPLPEALRTFGRFCFPKLSERHPQFVKPYRHPKAFLKTVENIIHVEVRKLYKDAETPHFSYKDPASNRLIIEYESKRKLCHFMEGLIEGVAVYFQSPIQYQQTRCALKEGKVCEFDLVFSEEEKPTS